MSKKKINRIFLFGDSFVEGQGIYKESEFNGQPDSFSEGELHGYELGLWRKKNSWEKYLKYYYPDVEYINYGRQGSDNYSQFGHFNECSSDFNENDLILFGFTSKYRDSPQAINYGYNQVANGGDSINTILHNNNPILKNCVAWEKISINDKFMVDGDTGSYKSKKEERLTENFLRNFYLSVFDESFFENIAQVNYLFYQEFCKTNPHLNIHFFDLFEPYVDKNFVSKNYSVDKNIYLTYDENDLHTFIAKHEEKNGEIIDGILSYWECGNSYPIKENKIHHPNQHGYKLWIDYMYNKWLKKKYK